ARARVRVGPRVILLLIFIVLLVLFLIVILLLILLFLPAHKRSDLIHASVRRESALLARPLLVSPCARGTRRLGGAGVPLVRHRPARQRGRHQPLARRPLQTQPSHSVSLVVGSAPALGAGRHRHPLFPQAETEAAQRAEHVSLEKEHRRPARQQPA